MASFTPLSAAIGGGLIGLSAVMLMMLNGRIAGISGIVGNFLRFPRAEWWSWEMAFLVGLVAAPLLLHAAGFALPHPVMPVSWTVIVAGGLLVGFGTGWSGGCTSGHGVCGIARFSTRSIAATLIFMATAMIVVAVTRHVLGAAL
jgi:uncharacterized membrane protein YedE/YeeE